ncbi:hypothetical protein F5X99DRAFT_430422 [Biscogniauxia marginata]|nr:hypothetical protein F5X99DRAFT_430422 [Biscogniauxia marginata]
MLLEQGDYKTIAQLAKPPMYEGDVDETNGEDVLLKTYWELIYVFVVCHNPGSCDARLDKIPDTIESLRTSIDIEKKDISSTEGLASRLRELFPSDFHYKLYSILRNREELWDLRDIVVARIEVENPIATIYDLADRSLVQVPLGRAPRWVLAPDIPGWARHYLPPSSKYSLSKTLSLLDILSSLVLSYRLEWKAPTEIIKDILGLSTSFADLILKNDPQNTKTRSFMRWMLAQVQFATGKHKSLVESVLAPLSGVYFYVRKQRFRQYVPMGIENPGWKFQGVDSKFNEYLKTVLKTSKRLSDYETETKVLEELIHITSDPLEEFEALSKLQELTRGDMYGYSHTLPSMYLISDTEESKRTLKAKITELFSIPGFTECLSSSQIWVLHMFQYVLESEKSAVEQASRRVAESFEQLPGGLKEMIIDVKWPAH